MSSRPRRSCSPGRGARPPRCATSSRAPAPTCSSWPREVVGEDPFPRADDGTNFAQPAIFCASLAGWACARPPLGELMAGHSLGELGALVAAGALDERDGLELVTLRGRLMYESGLAAGDGGMVAVIGAGAADHAAGDRRGPRADGRQRQLADAGGAVGRQGRRCPAAVDAGQGARPAGDGARRDRRVSLADDGRGGARVRAPRWPRPTFSRARGCTVISAVTAQPFADPRAELADALTMPVRWREVMLALHELGRRPVRRRRARPGPDRAGQADAEGRGARQCLSSHRTAARW